MVYLYIDIELVFNENVMQILWLNNSDTSDKFVFSEAYRDDRNSPYTIADRLIFIDEIITDAAVADIDIRELKIRTFSTRRRRKDRLGLGRV